MWPRGELIGGCDWREKVFELISSFSNRRMLKSHETHLSQIALSNVESSRTIAQVLYEMNDIHPV